MINSFVCRIISRGVWWVSVMTVTFLSDVSNRDVCHNQGIPLSYNSISYTYIMVYMYSGTVICLYGCVWVYRGGEGVGWLWWFLGVEGYGWWSVGVFRIRTATHVPARITPDSTCLSQWETMTRGVAPNRFHEFPMPHYPLFNQWWPVKRSFKTLTGDNFLWGDHVTCETGCLS